MEWILSAYCALCQVAPQSLNIPWFCPSHILKDHDEAETLSHVSLYDLQDEPRILEQREETERKKEKDRQNEWKKWGFSAS
jgi:hypothetical protein